MNIEDFLRNLNSNEGLNESLYFIEEIIVDKNKDFITSINNIILKPDEIRDTNKFASLLVDLKSSEFIPNLITIIRNYGPEKKKCISDYMYSLGELLDQIDYYEVDDNFVDILGNWMLNTGGGELSWKSGIILSNLKNEKVYNYLVLGVKNTNLFHLTRVECLDRLVNEYGKLEIELFKSLLNDKDKHFLEAVNEAIDYVMD